MSLFSFFGRKEPQHERQWEVGRPILAFLKDWNGEDDLPDEKPRSDNEIRFGPGVLDGIMSHHFGDGEGGKREHRVARFLDSLNVALKLGNDNSRAAVYSFFEDDEVLSFADNIVEAIVSQHRFSPLDLQPFARWLLENASHRGRFKLGILLLGICGDENDLEQLKLAASHPEFSLFASVALINLASDPTFTLWELAQKAKGWDKIQFVERLAPQSSERPEIQDWLLRSGFQNEIMYEYLAYICAVYGDLIGRLREPFSIDEELLDSIGSLMSSLMMGGPAQDLSDYDHGVEAVERLIGLWETRCDSLDRLGQLISVHRHLQRINQNIVQWESQGWTTEIVEGCVERCEAVMFRPHWPELIGQHTKTREELGLSWHISKAIGLDLWEQMFACLSQHPFNGWLYQELMQDKDEARKRQVMNFAEKHLPLESIASGPSDSMGMGPEFEAHMLLDQLLQYMNADFWNEKFILAALRSPVVRSRHGVLYALAKRSRHEWGKEIEDSFVRGWKEEIDDNVKRHFADVEAGREFSWNIPDNQL